MSIHWKSLDTAGKIEAIRSVYEPGMSSSQIASCFEGATRNAVIGLFHRYPDWMNGLQLRNAQNYPKKLRVTNGRYRSKHSKPLPQVALHATESHLCGQPLYALASHQCRWPVNDPEVGEAHLFCGMPSEKSYCEHHSSRAYRSPE